MRTVRVLRKPSILDVEDLLEAALFDDESALEEVALIVEDHGALEEAALREEDDKSEKAADLVDDGIAVVDGWLHTTTLSQWARMIVIDRQRTRGKGEDIDSSTRLDLSTWRHVAIRRCREGGGSLRG